MPCCVVPASDIRVVKVHHENPGSVKAKLLLAVCRSHYLLAVPNQAIAYTHKTSFIPVRHLITIDKLSIASSSSLRQSTIHSICVHMPMATPSTYLSSLVLPKKLSKEKMNPKILSRCLFGQISFS